MLRRSRHLLLETTNLPSLSMPLILCRTLRLQHLTPTQVERSKLEEIPYLDYAFLQRPKSLFVHHNAKRRTMTSLGGFYKSITDRYSSEGTDNGMFQSTIRRGNDSKNEGLFVLLLYSLHSYCTDMSPGSLESRIQSELASYAPGVRKIYKPKRHNVYIGKLVGLYQNGNDERIEASILSKARPQNRKNISSVLQAFLCLTEYQFPDLESWISCVSAPNVTEACFAIYGAYQLPSFIVNDILTRIPNSKYEVDLMLEIYGSMQLSRPLPFKTIENMIHYIKMFDIESLYDFVKLLIENQAFGESELNRLIHSISDSSMTSFNITEKENGIYLGKIIETEKLIYDTLLSSNMSLNTLGTLSLALSILPASEDRSSQFLKSINKNDLLEKKEIEVYNILKLSLERSPTPMIQIIDSIIETDELTFKVWNCFINKINQYDTKTLSSQQSRKLIEKYSKYQFMSHSQHELQKKLDSVDQIINTFNGRTNYFDNRSISNIIQKLYNHKINESFTSEQYSTIFGSNLDYARYIFAQLSTPSTSIIGQVLLGESKLNPKAAYSNYVHYLNTGPSSIPNENYIKSLIIPSIIHPELKWEEEDSSVRFASQIAVHEFRKHLLFPSADSSKSLVPSNTIWRCYILLCGRSNYQNELSEILPFWESINYIPSRKTLAMLLAALPLGNGEMIRKHALEVLSAERMNPSLPSNDSNNGVREASDLLGRYPWPSTLEIDNWRDKMTEDAKDIQELLT